MIYVNIDMNHSNAPTWSKTKSKNCKYEERKNKLQRHLYFFHVYFYI